ncbi:uncharacterized protein LOC131425672 [Malaya genurostris]|uniref:uncharacterized protein LOC131425672 n=1 Tax=Malaya genurostris TaxID=325434 RepID=UPI0026F3AD19|nr:uncharacterized protein LOC131425672 [Malaya genurostris]
MDNPVRPCRLCFHNEQDNVYTSIQEDRAKLSNQIRECVAIFNLHDDDIRCICRSCIATVKFIEEFRTLCHQTNELYNFIPTPHLNDIKSEQYYNTVNELHNVVQSKREALVQVVVGREQMDTEFIDLPSEEPPIKYESESDNDGSFHPKLQRDQCDDEHQFECKTEIVEMEENLTEELTYDSDFTDTSACRRKSRKSNSEPKQGPRLTLQLKLAIAQEIEMHPQLWNISIPCSAQTIDDTWAKVARKFEIDLSTFRGHWRRIKESYRELKKKKKIPANSTNGRLLAILSEIYDAGRTQIKPNKEIEPVGTVGEGEDTFGSEERKLILLQAVYKYPIIWSCKHLDYYNKEMRESVWDQISAGLGVTSSEAKNCWKRLRIIYKYRCKRFSNGQIQTEDLKIDPLFALCHEMFGGITQNDAFDSTTSKRDFKVFDNEKKFQFAQICSNYDIIWNIQHPDYGKIVKKDRTWDEIAAKMNISKAEAKFQWFRLRGVYRGRHIRLMEGLVTSNDPILADPLYLLLKKMLSENMTIGKSSGVSLSDEELPSKYFTSVDQKIKLVKEITKREVIWNSNHSDFRNMKIRQTSWQQIASQFKVRPLVAKAEWIRLKSLVGSEQSYGEANPKSTVDSQLRKLVEKLLPASRRKDNENQTTCDKQMETVGEGPKRHYRGVSSYDGAGCVRMDLNGTMRHCKICELCGKPVERSLFEYHMNQHYGLKPYACSFEGCDSKYGNKITRNRHEVMVHGEDGFKFTCSECGAKFKQKCRHDFHYALKHKSDEVPCDLCGKVFKHKKLLQKHRALHKSQYVCKVCGKILQKKWTLHVHMRVHTKEKPFPCELCDQRFMLKVQLKTHLLKIHGVLLKDLESAKANLENMNE